MKCKKRESIGAIAMSIIEKAKDMIKYLISKMKK